MKQFYCFFTLSLVLTLVTHYGSANNDDEKQKQLTEMDEKIDEALDSYKYSVVVDNMKELVAKLEKNGVKFENPNSVPAASNPEYYETLLKHVLKGKKVVQIKDWANRELPDENHIGGKREFSLFLENGFLRDCNFIQNLIKSLLDPLDADAELRKTVTEDTLSYWKIKKVCKFTMDGNNSGKFKEDLYSLLQTRYKKNNAGHENVFTRVFNMFNNRMKGEGIEDNNEDDDKDEVVE